MNTFFLVKKFQKSTVKCDDQQQYKSIIEASTVSTPDGQTNNSPIYVGMLGTLNNPSTRNLVGQFLALLDAKQRTGF